MILRAEELLLLQDADIIELGDEEIDHLAGARKRKIDISPEKLRKLQRQFLLRIEAYKEERRQARETYLHSCCM